MRVIRCNIIGSALFLLASLTFATELKSDEHNYGFSVPDGWTVTFQNVAGFSVGSPDRTKTVTLLIRKVHFRKLDAFSIAQIERELTIAGGRVFSSRNLTNDGVFVHESVFKLGRGPVETVHLMRQMLADGKFYLLAGSYAGDDAAHGADVQVAMDSFHFLRPPRPTSLTSAYLPFIVAVAGAVILGVFWLMGMSKRVNPQ